MLRATAVFCLLGAPLAALWGAVGAGAASAARGVYPCFSEIPPMAGNPQWGFHTGAPITGRNGTYARAEGDVDLARGAVNGTICQVNVVAGSDRLIVLKPTGKVVSHTHYGELYGHAGNLMVVDVKVTSSTDKACPVGTVGKMTVEATYNGVESSTVEFAFPPACRTHTSTYHGAQVEALVPES